LDLNFGTGWYWNNDTNCPYRVIVPDSVHGLPLGHEYVYVDLPTGEREQFPIHRYAPMYQIPFLYEEIVYRHLGCRTPGGMIRIIDQAFRSREVTDMAGMRTLEPGAGSGTFGEYLKKYLGIRYLAGLDIEPLAKAAAERDRPDLYSNYVIEDLTRLSRNFLDTAGTWDFVVMASAVGWNHIPVEGVQQAFDLLRIGGWFAIHVSRTDSDIGCRATCAWIDGLAATGQFDLVREERIFHRKAIDGHDIFYTVIVGVKTERMR